MKYYSTRDSQKKYYSAPEAICKGLAPADDVSGKPVVMEIVMPEIAQPEVAKKTKEEVIYYRIPAMCTVKLKDGATLLLQSRMPVYQLGQDSSIPASLVLK